MILLSHSPLRGAFFCCPKSFLDTVNSYEYNKKHKKNTTKPTILGKSVDVFIQMSIMKTERKRIGSRAGKKESENMFKNEDLEKFAREKAITIDDDAMQALAEMFDTLKNDDEVESWQGGESKYGSDSYSENLHAKGDTVEEFIASAIKVLFSIVEGSLDDDGNLTGWDFADICVNEVRVTMNKQRHVYLQ